MDFFTCIFQEFQCLINFTLSIKNQINKTNKNHSITKKMYERYRGHSVVY